MTGGKGTARCAAVLCGISLNRILSWLSVLIEAALGVNFFVPLLFSVDAQGVYRRGALFPLAMAPVLVVLPPLTQDFMRYDGPDKIKRVARLFFLLPLIAVALTCVNAGHEYPLVKRAGGAPQMYGSYQWSMEDYREQLRQYREQNAEGSQEAWDEMEKSVVSRVADDVRVSILGRTVEMTIVKRMA